MKDGNVVLAEPPMAKKKPEKSAPKSEGKQINFRASDALAARIEHVAKALGLDVSNFVRMVLTQNLHKYEADLPPKTGAGEKP